MPKRYWLTITDQIYDLSVLSSEEQAFLGEMFELYSSRPRMTQFVNACMRRGLATIWKKGDYETSPAYQICQDLQARLGIAEKKLFPPDYRDYLAALIEERFPSRYRFCKEIGIAESHLSRVLAGKKELARESYEKIKDALGLEDGPLIPRRERSDYLELDNPVAELAALDHRVKWLERRRKELLESEPNAVTATAERAPAPSRPWYLPKDIAALDSVEAVTKAIQQMLTEIRQLGERISKQAEADLPGLVSPPTPLPEPQPRPTPVRAARAARVQEVASALSSLTQRKAPLSSESSLFKRLVVEEERRVSTEIGSFRKLWGSEELGSFRKFSKPGRERIVVELNGWLSALLRSQNVECAVLRYRDDQITREPFLSELASSLDNQFPGIKFPGIIRALAFNPSVTILDISGMKNSVEEHIRRLAEENGVQFLRWAEFQRVQHNQEHVVRAPMMRQWVENRLVIRYVVEPALLDPLLFYKIVQSPELHSAGLILSLMHASVLEQGVMDFLVLDNNREPVSDPNQLYVLLQPEFYKQFGVSHSHLLENWNDFYSLGLSQGARTLVTPGLKKERTRDVPKERVEDFVRKILGSDFKIVNGAGGRTEGREELKDDEQPITVPHMGDVLLLRRKAA